MKGDSYVTGSGIRMGGWSLVAPPGGYKRGRCAGDPGRLLRSIFVEPVLWLLGAVLTLPLILWKWGTRRLHLVRLGSKFPGPFSMPIIGNILDSGSMEPVALFNWMLSILRPYAPLFRYYMGPFLLIVSMHPEDNERILSGYKFVNKSHLYNMFLEPWLGDGLLLSQGSKWRARRKQLTPAFHFKILDQFQPVFLSCGDEFVAQLQKRASGDAFDVWPFVKLLTLDVICETAMGVKMNAQTDRNSKYVNAVDEIANITVRRIVRPWLHPDFLFYWTPIGRRYKKCLEVLHGTTNKVIRERREEILNMSENLGDALDIDELGRRRRVAFLDLLLLEARNGNFSDSDIREEVDTFMFEGHDTTASAISFTMFALSRHEDVQDKILEELKSVFDWSQPLQPTIQQLSELKYLEMVVKESLRMYPPVPLIYRDIPEDEKLPTTGHIMPAGSLKEVSIYLIQNCKDLYPDPEKFDPERFSSEQSAKRHPYAFLPFSAGPRNCIGQRFAMLELKSVLAKVVWNYRLLPDSSYEPQLSWKLVLKSENGVRVRLERRR